MYYVENHHEAIVDRELFQRVQEEIARRSSRRKVAQRTAKTEPLCTWFFGADYAETGKVLRAMLPVVVVILPSYILGFPTLTAMGLTKYANYSVVFGSVLHVLNLCVLYFTGHLNMVSLGILVSVAESAILIFRIAVILTHKNRWKEERA